MNCAKCSQNISGTPWEYTVHGIYGDYTYDVSQAEAIVLSGHAAQEVPLEVLEKLAEANPPNEDHLKHVPDNRPGIVARTGNKIALINGTHRLHRALRNKTPFLVYMLSSSESEQCLVRYPIPFRIA